MNNIARRVIVGVAVGIIMMLVHQLARSYPATAGYTWGCGSGYVGSCDACFSSLSGTAFPSGTAMGQNATVANCSGANNYRPYFKQAIPSGNNFILEFCAEANLTDCNQPYIAYRSSESSGTCPNGGFLSGSNCNCPLDQTDTGSSCTNVPCPAHQLPDPGVNNECRDKCVEGRAGGDRLFPAGVSTACGEMGAQFDFNGNLNTPHMVNGQEWLLHCRVKSTGKTTICSDQYGGATTCYSSDSRVVGGGAAAYCPPPTVGPESGRQPAEPTPKPDQADVNTCSPGDLWCKNTTGTCAAGFSGGEFNGTALCIKNGETVTQQPQPDSALNPPTSTDRSNPPSSFPPGEAPPSGTEGVTPADRVAVGIGGAANGVGGVPGSGSGTGSGGGGEIITCGLPGTPPCKIDEAGTPNGVGTDTAAKATLDGEASKLTDKITEAVSGSNAPNSSWGFGISFPSSCSAMSIPTNNWGTFSVNFCQWQGIAHDLMSLVWVAATIFLTLGMVSRAANG